MLRWIIIGVYVGIMMGLSSCQYHLQDKIEIGKQNKLTQSQSIERRKTMSIFSPERVFVSFIIHRFQEDKLEAEYSLSNQSEMDVYIFNQLYDTDLIGNATINPNRVYVFIEDDDTVVLAKKVMKIPKGILVEYPEVPFISLIHPGESISEKIILPLPVKLYHPYLKSSLSGQVKYFKHIRFEVGILPASPDLKLREGRLSDGTKFLSPHNGQALQRQITLSSKMLDSSIPVIGK